MAIDLSNISELCESAPIDPEQELAEAKAHGFDTVKEYYDWLTGAYDFSSMEEF